MKIGIPTEIKNNENRVSITPIGVKELVSKGHEVFIQNGAGEGSNISNEEYIKEGAHIVEDAKTAWNQEMVLKVKEPQEEEFKFFREGLILFTYLHLAAEEKLFNALLEKKVIAFAYETVQEGRKTPLLRPMSEIAGRRSINVGNTFLEKIHGGSGILLSGVSGVKRGKVTVVGGGISGYNAAIVAAGMGANVDLLELDEERIRYLDEICPANIQVLKSNELNIYNSIKEADLVVSTILIPGAKAPKLVKEYMVKEMKKGSVIIDISIDQGGSVETIDEITTHDNPIRIKHGVLHYSVANMPGATPQTSTYALTNATIKYVVNLAQYGCKDVVLNDNSMKLGLNTYLGKCTLPIIAKTFGVEYIEPEELLK